ncbi:hypothetical protein Acr_20g0010240 [Actinidia rufa]|uniref:Uncharacterized protein n=1 Tax=Actinidia rufa TaxID=165716 RepID=A0A7J0GEH9_9ERIC|nr:hypothetical protein Acr_20g0010240 [Actinidia rufa]
MESQQTGSLKPSKAKGKGKQSQRIWTVREEEGFLVCMLEEFKVGNYYLERTKLRVKWQRMRLKFEKMLLMMQLINPVMKNHLLAPMIATFLGIQMECLCLEVPDFMDLSAGGSQNASPSTPTSNANATTPPTNASASTTTRPLKKVNWLW